MDKAEETLQHCSPNKKKVYLFAFIEIYIKRMWTFIFLTFPVGLYCGL